MALSMEVRVLLPNTKKIMIKIVFRKDALHVGARVESDGLVGLVLVLVAAVVALSASAVCNDCLTQKKGADYE